MDCSMPGFLVCVPSLHYLSDFAQIHAHYVNDSIQLFHLCCPLVLLPSVFTSIRVFCSELALHIRWPAIKGFASRAFLVARTVKHSRAVQETWIQFLCHEDPLEKEMATQPSILAWTIPWTGSLWSTVHGVTNSISFKSVLGKKWAVTTHLPGKDNQLPVCPSGKPSLLWPHDRHYQLNFL